MIVDGSKSRSTLLQHHALTALRAIDMPASPLSPDGYRPVKWRICPLPYPCSTTSWPPREPPYPTRPSASRSRICTRPRVQRESTRCSSTRCVRPIRRSPSRLAKARTRPRRYRRKEESELLIDVAPHSRISRRACSASTPKSQALEAQHHELAPLYAVKRQFVQRKAMNAHKADVAATFDGAALRAAIDAAIGPLEGVQAFELAFARAVTHWLQDEAANAERTRSRAALRGVGSAYGGRQVARTAAACCSVRRASSTVSSSCPPRRSTLNDGVGALQIAGGARTAPPRRLRADRSRDRSRRRARPGELLHLVPRAGQGFVLARAARRRSPRPTARRRQSVQESRLRRAARRLPARREDLRVPQAARRGLADRRAGDDLRRQPDGRRHRASHLQRLHEVVHLPEAGSGRHSAGGDAHAEGRARAAVGLRDLFAADALESAQPAPARAAAADRQARARRRHGPGRLHARASPAERRPYGRRHRRPQDRAARPGAVRRRRRAASACRSRRSATSRRCASRSTTA